MHAFPSSMGGARRWLSHCLLVVVVALALGHQEHVLVASTGAIGHRVGDRVGLLPDDVEAQIPAVCLQGEGGAPRDADHVLAAKL